MRTNVRICFVDANKIAVQKMYESYPIFSWNDKYLNDTAFTDTAFTSCF